MKKTIKQICIDYFEGSVNEAGAKTVVEFLHASESNRAQFKKWENEWKIRKVEELESYSGFKKVVAANKKNRRTRVAGWSASICACCAAVCALFIHLFPAKNVEQPAPLNYFTVQTGYCEQTTIILPDSTSVTLNAASKLTYAHNFMQGDRNVYLEGEAYFDVTKSKEQPFVVNMNDGKITVYGTKFNVAAYPSEDVLEASLLEGSIKFETASATVALQPGDMVSYSAQEDHLVKQRGDVEGSASWKSGTLKYTSCSLSKLLTRISSIYGVSIEYNPTNNNDHLLGAVLNLREPAPNILDALASIAPVKWTLREDGTYYVQDR